MSASITATDVKTILNRAGDRSGFKFLRGNPFYANNGRYEAMAAKWVELKELNAAKLTPRVIKSVDNFLATCHDKVMSY
ncbi:hypothetical protein AAM37_gp76 [Pantoea phage vB_PagM_AAM37]|uniref:Uncharacterized protein n=1 Tax=Pantoea phage vB_PagM_AAM37 TaxID=2588093 RepID=A0A513ZYJ1_9CAUD|nr:hypothetical protein HWC22_gp76 [Pantoea phage vB_PagM_AAM37]QDH45747.1 hypothetical protein AAM37_gp76 [Pantoea phage vB_PagM_AAM37]